MIEMVDDRIIIKGDTYTHRIILKATGNEDTFTTQSGKEGKYLPSEFLTEYIVSEDLFEVIRRLMIEIEKAEEQKGVKI